MIISLKSGIAKDILLKYLSVSILAIFNSNFVVTFCIKKKPEAVRHDE
jgi:hypothetical protein